MVKTLETNPSNNKIIFPVLCRWHWYAYSVKTKRSIHFCLAQIHTYTYMHLKCIDMVYQIAKIQVATLSIYLVNRCNYRKKQSDRKSSICWLTPQMTVIARTGAGGSQEPWSFLLRSHVGAWAQVLDTSPTAFSSALIGNGKARTCIGTHSGCRWGFNIVHQNYGLP